MNYAFLRRQHMRRRQSVAVRGGGDAGPALSLPFSTMTSLADLTAHGITFTRPSVANNSTESAVIAAAVDEPRLDALIGLQYEKTADNRLLANRDFSASGWTLRGSATRTQDMGQTRPDGTAGAWLISVINTNNDVFRVTAGHPASERTSPSFYIKRVSTSGILEIKDASNTGRWQVNLALLGDGWEWVTDGHAAVTVVTPFVATAGGASGFWLLGTGSAVSFYIDYAQVENGTVATSPIDTTTVVATRAADNAAFTIPDGVSQITVTFDDDTTQKIGVAPGSYSLPTDLYRPRIKSVVSTVETPDDYHQITSLTDSAALVSVGSETTFRKRGSVFGRAIFDTDATSVSVDVYNNLSSLPKSQQTVGVIVDGAYYATMQSPGSDFTAPGRETLTQSLPAGSKRVEIIAGIQTRPITNLPPNAITLDGITFNAAATRVTPASTTNRVFVYGDSIAVGDQATPITQNAWVLKLRESYADSSVQVCAWGYRSLWEDAQTSALRAALVAEMAAANPTAIWLAIGTNDYGLNRWTAASFETAYAALLDDINAALPSVAVFAQTPLVRTTETANGSGNTLGDYRAAISNAVSARTAFATLVDGTAILTTDDLADGLHPTTAGHATYAAFVLATLPA